MTRLQRAVSTSALTIFLGSGAMVAADLSEYRGFRFGSDLAAVAAHAGANPSQAKTTYRRPALI